MAMHLGDGNEGALWEIERSKFRRHNGQAWVRGDGWVQAQGLEHRHPTVPRGVFTYIGVPS